MENTVVKELNALLKGNYMAIHGYEKFIQNVEDPVAKNELQRIQKEHKQNAAAIAERIQNLGGVPEDGPGLMGTMGELMNRLKGVSGNTEFIIKDALESEDKGIKMAEELVRGDLDPESRKLVEDILNVNRQHVSQLNNLLN
ncbi:MAG TPA: PA2169 family four-helix-bundle protein [Acetivibrio sp.]|jgi:bacterioferritin|nr:PA2169 family four-helix-bundle protein [Clostridium sp.]HOQ36675.1 PA2169 family four-helix-bundle protein [Acetivibrio sp.]HPT90840.1 PA2169 family four-helix-bundle protein [Acetivibrio sp.]HQA58963.1 PA2169 family four-helix-bundle protein [Acetivibrio sp.]